MSVFLRWCAQEDALFLRGSEGIGARRRGSRDVSCLTNQKWTSEAVSSRLARRSTQTGQLPLLINLTLFETLWPLSTRQTIESYRISARPAIFPALWAPSALGSKLDYNSKQTINLLSPHKLILSLAFLLVLIYDASRRLPSLEGILFKTESGISFLSGFVCFFNFWRMLGKINFT